jgi:tetratricopeptide (TPR) repeat protein
LIIYIALAVAVLAVYGQVYQFDFVNMDDNVYVTENVHLQKGFSAEGIRWAVTTTYAEFWHPLTWLSLMLDYRLFGLNAGGYHLTSLLLHILSTLLLFGLFNRMTGAVWKSAFVAAFFALHPLHVESVAWVSERKDVLSAFFWMLTLYLYVWYTEKPAIKRYLPVAGSFVLALMSKPMVVTLPLILFLLDYWPLKRFAQEKGSRFVRQAKEKLPLFALSAVFSVITIYAQHKPGGRDLQFPLATRLANALVSFVSYLEKTFWPFNLAAFYPFPDGIPALKIAAALLLIAVICVFVIAAARRLPYLATGWGWFVITILPVIGIIPTGDFAMADRYTYLPSIGIAIMLAWGVPALAQNRSLRKSILFLAAILFLACLAFLTWKQCGYWQNDPKLFNRMLQVTRNNYLAHINLGTILLQEGKAQEAAGHFSEVIRIKPDLILGYTKRATAYARLGRYPEAFDDLDKIILQKPDYADAYVTRGGLHLNLAQYQKAIEDFGEAIRLTPDNASAYYNRGNAYIHLGNHQEAIEDFSRAIQLNPAYVDAYNNRGFIHLQSGRYPQALEDYTEAIRLKPDYANAWNNRAFVYLRTGNMESGCADARKACDMGMCNTLQLAQTNGLCR